VEVAVGEAVLDGNGEAVAVFVPVAVGFRVGVDDAGSVGGETVLEGASEVCASGLVLRLAGAGVVITGAGERLTGEAEDLQRIARNANSTRHDKSKLRDFITHSSQGSNRIWSR
jgi:hypothetical protein